MALPAPSPDPDILWKYTPGAIAWAKRLMLDESNNIKKCNPKEENYLWWPTILFPSWKEAALSELMCPIDSIKISPSPQQAMTDQYKVGPRVKIAGVGKTRSFVTQLCHNLVPKRAALGPKNANNLRENIVGYYLGVPYDT